MNKNNQFYLLINGANKLIQFRKEKKLDEKSTLPPAEFIERIKHFKVNNYHLIRSGNMVVLILNPLNKDIHSMPILRNVFKAAAKEAGTEITRLLMFYDTYAKFPTKDSILNDLAVHFGERVKFSLYDQTLILYILPNTPQYNKVTVMTEDELKTMEKLGKTRENFKRMIKDDPLFVWHGDYSPGECLVIEGSSTVSLNSIIYAVIAG